jgi:isochorismate synthase
MIDFFIKVKQQEKQNLPFVIYSKPNKRLLEGFFQKDEHLYFAEDFNEKGFVFSPFNGDQIVLIPKKKSHKWVTILPEIQENSSSKIEVSNDKFSQKTFENLVQKGIDHINKGDFNKVVLSRKEIIDVPDFDLVSVFEKLVFTYPSAYTYCWFHPKVGLWMGATPERLLKSKNNKFYTVALAGTQLYNDNLNVDWNSKEAEEQHIVTNYIIDNLKELTSEVNISSPYTIKAGNLLHIKTDIEGLINENSNLKQIVTALHPTPAVCGLPEYDTKNFILQNEGYNREYYTGFLGEINKKGINKINIKSDLFVNLRCMQIKNKQAYLYIGCGITKDSIPEKEWEESVNKSKIMRKILL